MSIMARRLYVNDDPRSLGSGSAPRDQVKIDFANRLQKAMIKKGWNQSELARRAGDYLKEGNFSRDLVSHYIRGVALPQPARLAALAKALGVKPADLLPNAPTAAQKAPAFDMRQTEDGKVWVRLNQAFTFEQAMEIMAIVNQAADD